jgi:hypothetical protein
MSSKSATNEKMTTKIEFPKDIWKEIMSLVPTYRCGKCDDKVKVNDKCKCKSFVCEKCVINCEWCGVKKCLCCLKKTKKDGEEAYLCRDCKKNGVLFCIECGTITNIKCDNCDLPFCGICDGETICYDCRVEIGEEDEEDEEDEDEM